MWRLVIPLRYLRIDHPEKWKFDAYLPMFLAALFSIPVLSRDFRVDVMGGKIQVFENVGSFLGILTGFFIAALAAVATFGKTQMDSPMPGDNPMRLEHRVNQERYFENLSRRRFLSFLFGYLAWMTLILCIVGYCYFIADRYYFSWAVSDELRHGMFRFVWIIYMLGIGNILSNTLLGLYYLTDRIHRPDKVIRQGTATDSDATSE
jgi:hypothetical protein